MNNNHDLPPVPPAIGEDDTLRQPSHMSDLCYKRNCADPLMTAYPTPSERRQLVHYSDIASGAAEQDGNTSEAIDFKLDALYRSLPLEPAASTIRRIQNIRPIIEQRVGMDLKPDEKLGLQMRLIDLSGLEVFRGFHASTGNKASEDMASKFLQATCVAQIQNGAKLLANAQKTHQQLSDETVQQDLRGKMFELLVATDRRRRLFSSEQYTDKVLMTATGFEDHPRVTYSPNHNYDLIVFDSSGATTDIYQCKNGHSSLEYAPEVKKIEGMAFRRFFEHPDQYINAMLTIADNSPMVPEETLVKSKKLIEGLFFEHPSTANKVGDLALR